MFRVGIRPFGRGVGVLGVVALAAAPMVWVAGSPASAEPSVETFTVAGASSWTVPQGVSCVTVDAVGAAGGDATFFGEAGAASNGGTGNVGASAVQQAGGLGGEAVSTIPVLAGQTLDVNVGGRGGDAEVGGVPATGGPGGFNGGAKGGDANATNEAPGAGGGGASDVVQSGQRAVIGGGGGGAGGFSHDALGAGGAGGGTTGDPGQNGENGATGGGGGSQVAGGVGGASGGGGTAVGADGTLGAGGAGAQDTDLNGGGGGGGGGYYGGGGGGGITPGFGAAAGGGGGSGFGDTLTTGVDAGNAGNGKVTLSYTVGDTSCLAAPLTINKVMAGATATPGTTYTMTLACSDPTIDPRPFGGTLSEEGLGSVDVTFTVDGAGVAQPASGYAIGFVGPTNCTVTETGAGLAAAASYQCSGAFAARSIAPQAKGWAVASSFPDDPCLTDGPQPGSIGVLIEEPDQQATVTVTNTLVAAVNIAPKFTG